MTINQRVEAFLRKHRTFSLCDECITRALGIKNAQPVTSLLLVRRGFWRAPGSCALCDRERVVTRAS